MFLGTHTFRKFISLEGVISANDLELSACHAVQERKGMYFMNRVLSGIAMIFLATSACAQEFSQDALIGRWEFVSYAEIASPDERTNVGVIVEFHADGRMITELRSGDREGTYRVEDETVFFIGGPKDQIWQVHEFEPNTALVLVDQPDITLILNVNTLMYLERQ